jgi:LysM repeat protein
VLKFSSSNPGNVSEEKSDVNKRKAQEVKNQQSAGKTTLLSADVDKLGTNKYIVTKGDNLHTIAKNNNLNLAQLLKLNSLSGDEILTPGQILVVK